jgi:DNA-directed RNA polymerase subunit RPC12/RpoP
MESLAVICHRCGEPFVPEIDRQIWCHSCNSAYMVVMDGLGVILFGLSRARTHGIKMEAEIE